MGQIQLDTMGDWVRVTLANPGKLDSAQHREGVTAFIEKRPPRFQRG